MGNRDSDAFLISALRLSFCSKMPKLAICIMSSGAGGSGNYPPLCINDKHTLAGTIFAPLSKYAHFMLVAFAYVFDAGTQLQGAQGGMPPNEKFSMVLPLSQKNHYACRFI